MSDEPLRMITIYHHAKDYPQFNFVARQWFIVAGKVWTTPELFAKGDTLREVRKSIPPWMVCMAPAVEDDPVIVETWI